MTNETQHREWCARYRAKHHESAEQRAALRSALSDAAHLCDAIMRDILAENPRGRSGTATARGQELAEIAKRCADAVWAMCEEIDVSAASKAAS